MAAIGIARRLLALALVLGSGAAGAEDYPSRPMTVTIGLAAGSGADVLVRHFTARLADLAGQPVVVQNKVGAFNAIAAAAVARAKPDGYSILFSGSAIVAGGRHLVKDLPFDGLKDLIPVAVFAESPFVLCVGPNSPHRTVAGLVAALKGRPRTTFGYTSPVAFITTKAFISETGLDATAVAYKSASDALPDLVNGTLDFVIFDSAFVLGQIKSGRIHALAVTSAKRIPALSDVPTMQEAGVKNYAFSPWWGVYVPAGTPQPIVDKLADWMKRIAATPDTVAFVESIANVPVAGGAPEAAALLKADAVQWDRLAAMANLQPQ